MKVFTIAVAGAGVALVSLILTVLLFVNVGAAAIRCGAADDTGFILVDSGSAKVVRPLPAGVGRVTSDFSPHRKHPLSGRVRAHKGTDFGAPQGSRILAAADGVVAFAGRQGEYGNIVIISHSLPGGRVSTAYAHIKNGGIHVRAGQRVRAGQHIAAVGSTGASTGPHLHFEVRMGGVYGRATNPRPWLERNGALSVDEVIEGGGLEECPLATAPRPTPSQPSVA